MTYSIQQAIPRKQRIEAIDVFRGLIIFLMCLVNNPGSWGHVYTPLLEADWSGYGIPDLIFPGFIFLVGMAVPLSLDRRLASGESRLRLFRHVLIRSIILFFIGVAIHMVPDFDLANVRIPGVLQRIAFVYLCGSCIYIFCRPNAFWLAIIGAVILLIYWPLMTLVPLPNGAAPALTPTGNLDAYISNLLLKGHLWEVTKTWDPEGIVSSFAAIATGLSGIWAGKLIKSSGSQQEKALVFLISGVVLVALGQIWGIQFPIIKKLWTSSFVLVSGGWSMILLAFLIWIYDIRGFRKPFKLFAMLGRNALILYIVEELLGSILAAGTGYIIYENIYQNIISPSFGSLLYALTVTALISLLGVTLYRFKIFIKI
ncbi:MAG: DUF5009 domain-containing protein [Lentisphaerae bacterium]|nr:DUF5009 domain-containing protein [Lentisphaerota bacterium]MCP4101593.1 DUF5009 domain-containing protein [Lentisphaerota bacterium]